MRGCSERRSSWTLRRVSRPMGRRPLVRRSPWQQRGRREVVAIRVESEPQIITCWLIFGTKDCRRLDGHDSVSRRQDVYAPPENQCASDEHVAVAKFPRTAHGLLPRVERAAFKPCRVRAESLPQIRERDCVLVARCHPRPIPEPWITKEIQDGVPQREGGVLLRSRVANLRLEGVQQCMEQALVIAEHIVQGPAMPCSESSKGRISGSIPALGSSGRISGGASASFAVSVLSHVLRSGCVRGCGASTHLGALSWWRSRGEKRVNVPRKKRKG